MYPGLAESWIKGNLDEFIHRNWVAPALSEAEAKKNESMADNLAKSIAMNMKGGFDDYRLYRTNRQGNSLLAQIADNTRPRMNKKRQIQLMANLKIHHRRTGLHRFNPRHGKP